MPDRETTESQAKCAGSAARSRGANYWESPYPGGSALQVAWKSGWDTRDARLKANAYPALQTAHGDLSRRVTGLQARVDRLSRHFHNLGFVVFANAVMLMLLWLWTAFHG